MCPLCLQDTPLDVLAKALYSPDVQEQLRATSRFRKCLSVGKSVWVVCVDEKLVTMKSLCLELGVLNMCGACEGMCRGMCRGMCGACAGCVQGVCRVCAGCVQGHVQGMCGVCAGDVRGMCRACAGFNLVPIKWIPILIRIKSIKNVFGYRFIISTSSTS